MIDAARRTGARAHILHLSDAHSLPAIRAAKAEGVALTVETCPHYLTIVAEEIPDGASEFKCCPPIREAANRDLLWEGVVDGTIDAIVSDHSPSTVDLKRSGGGDFGLAWGGIAGLQVGLVGGVDRGAGPRHPARDDPAALHDRSRQRRRPGRRRASSSSARPRTSRSSASTTRFAIDAARLLHKNPITAYDHRVLTGRIRRTWLHGKSMYNVTEGGAGRGAAVPRQAARPAAVGALAAAAA